MLFSKYYVDYSTSKKYYFINRLLIVTVTQLVSLFDITLIKKFIFLLKVSTSDSCYVKEENSDFNLLRFKTEVKSLWTNVIPIYSLVLLCFDIYF